MPASDPDPDHDRTPRSQALAFALGERAHCLSDREWRHRLRGYGYEIRQTPTGLMLTHMATGAALGRLDAD